MKQAVMDPVGKARWFIETHFASEITLDDIAAVAGVSRYHPTRAFGDTMDHSAMQYLRGRRLTDAARALASGTPDILTGGPRCGIWLTRGTLPFSNRTGGAPVLRVSFILIGSSRLMLSRCFRPRTVSGVTRNSHGTRA